jgi:hypothetical protein
MKHVPALPVTLFVRAGGMAEKQIPVRVRAGVQTDVGRIVLAPKIPPPKKGVVAGRVLYDDRTPALGAAIGRFMWWAPEKEVDATGAFRRQVPAGRHVLDCSLDGAVRWPRDPAEDVLVGEGLPLRFSTHGRDTVLVPVDVKAGQTIRKEIILPRKQLRSIRIQWRGPIPKSRRLTVIVTHAGGCFIRRAVARWKDKRTCTLADLPAGRTVLIAGSENYFGFLPAPRDGEDVELVIDAAQASVVAGRVRRPDGTPARRVSLALRAAALLARPDLDRYIANHWPGIGRVATTSQADGSYRFPALAPGKYILELHGPGQPHRQPIEVRAKRTTTVNVTAETPSVIPPPLRQPQGRPAPEARATDEPRAAGR